MPGRAIDVCDYIQDRWRGKPMPLTDRGGQMVAARVAHMLQECRRDLDLLRTEEHVLEAILDWKQGRPVYPHRRRR